MEITLTEQDLLSLAKQVAPLISPAKPDQDWVKLEEIRADLFAGKAKSWIRLYIFDQFPEVQIENGNPKAWVVGAHGKARSLRSTCHMRERGCMSTTTRSTGRQRR
jgi:hypothetical protein